MIRLKNDYVIKCDNAQYILAKEQLAERKETKEPYITESVQGYYSSLEHCLQAYCRKVMMNKVAEEEMSLQDVLEVLQELKEEVAKYD